MVDLTIYDVLLFDMDGVIYKGNEAVPGSIQALNFLESQGKRLYFVTNSASKSRESNCLKLISLGYNCRLEQIYCTSYTTPIYIARKAPHIRHIFAMGSDEFLAEFKKADFQITTISDISGLSIENIAKIRPDPTIQAVVFALSVNFSYFEGLYASFCIQNGAEFFTCNFDPYMSYNPFNLPGSGSVLAFLETATQRKATVIGKPERFFLDLISEKETTPTSRWLMVGDRVNTDILFGVKASIDTALVLTGASSRETLELYDYTPTYISDSLADLIGTTG